MIVYLKVQSIKARWIHSEIARQTIETEMLLAQCARMWIEGEDKKEEEKSMMVLQNISNLHWSQSSNFIFYELLFHRVDKAKVNFRVNK